jgi:hypothetical protein
MPAFFSWKWKGTIVGGVRRRVGDAPHSVAKMAGDTLLTRYLLCEYYSTCLTSTKVLAVVDLQRSDDGR